jgi:hypothetical protein
MNEQITVLGTLINLALRLKKSRITEVSHEHPIIRE